MQQSSQKNNNKFSTGLLAGIVAGLISSISAQPFEVIKVAMLVNPTKSEVIDKSHIFKSFTQAIREVYKANNKGFYNYFLGSEMSFLRQSIGFAGFSYLIGVFNEKLSCLDNSSPLFVKYGTSAAISKAIVMTVTAPITLLKTRFELIHYEREGIGKELNKVFKGDGFKILTKGLNALLVKECLFSIFQYSSYRYFRYYFIESDFQSISDEKVIKQKQQENMFKNFIPAYLSGVFGSIMVQPLVVVKRRMIAPQKHLQEKHQYQGVVKGVKKVVNVEGVKGLFKAFIPYVIQKPIRIGLAWGLYEIIKDKRNLQTY